MGELPLIGFLVGAFVAGGIVFYESTFATKKMAAGIPRAPEDRMPLAMIGGILFPVTMFWFAWSANYNSVPWIVPTLVSWANFSFLVMHICTMCNMLTCTSIPGWNVPINVHCTRLRVLPIVSGRYVHDVRCKRYCRKHSESLSEDDDLTVSAINTPIQVCRSALGAVSPLFTEQMFDAMGVGGAGSLIGGVAVLLAPIPFIFYRYGAKIRSRSKFAPTESAIPQKPTTEMDQEQGRIELPTSRSGHSSSDEEKPGDYPGSGGDMDKQSNTDLENQSNTDPEEQAPRTNRVAPPKDPYLDATGLEEAE